MSSLNAPYLMTLQLRKGNYRLCLLCKHNSILDKSIASKTLPVGWAQFRGKERSSAQGKVLRVRCPRGRAPAVWEGEVQSLGQDAKGHSGLCGMWNILAKTPLRYLSFLFVFGFNQSVLLPKGHRTRTVSPCFWVCLGIKPGFHGDSLFQGGSRDV